MKRTRLNKKPKKHSQYWYRQKCVAEAKKQAKDRDEWICQRCGKNRKAGYQIHGSHIFSEGHYHSMSAMVENIDAMCANCHWWWHENPIESGDWFRAKNPQRWKELKAESIVKPPKQVDWKALYEGEKVIHIKV